MKPNFTISSLDAKFILTTLLMKVFSANVAIREIRSVFCFEKGLDADIVSQKGLERSKTFIFYTRLRYCLPYTFHFATNSFSIYKED